MKHLAILKHADRAAINGKSFHRRASGSFYTHELIGRAIACTAVAALPDLPSEPSIIDPFCGDGRLLEWTLEELHERGVSAVRASLWDHNPDAVEVATKRVHATANRLGMALHADAWAGDTFDRAVGARERWNLVLTNPPWELLKPDRREMSRLPEAKHAEYVAELRAFDQRLAAEYPVSQPSRRFAGWGTNLSRVGTEVALRLTADGGVCAVVCPSSLLADSTSAGLRRWLLERYALLDLAHYPAEARLFDSVDVPCCTFVARRGVTQDRTRITKFNAVRGVEQSSTIQLSRDWLARRQFAIPVQLGAEGISLLKEFDDRPTLATLEGPSPQHLWAGRELDETGRKRFTRSAGEHPFVRSAHVSRLGPVRFPTDEFVDTTQRKVPASARNVRMVWRDISRPSQKRRVHASILPSGPITGNSVSVAYFRDGDHVRLLALLAVVSSLPFEFQVRSLLMTNHVSLSVMRAARVPEFDQPLTLALAEAAFASLNAEPGAEQRLEEAVAGAYGLDPEMWTRMAGHFAYSQDEIGELAAGWAG